MDELIRSFFTHLERIIIGATIVAFVIHQIILLIRKSPHALDGAFLKCLTAAGIPNGLAFIFCAMDGSYTTLMQGSSLAFALAGLALLSVSIRDLGKLYTP